MSLLICDFGQDGVIALSDTLATTTDGTPAYFTTKALVIPHMSVLIAGTGSANLVERWRETVLSSVLSIDIEMLNLHTPNGLRAQWTALESQFEGEWSAGSPSATVYQAGPRESDGTYVAYAYRSEDDFEPELLEPGLRLRPSPIDPTDVVPPSTAEDWIALALRIRDEQDHLPADERVEIGGDLMMTIMTDRKISIAKIARFEDHETDWLLMNRFQQPPGSNQQPG